MKIIADTNIPFVEKCFSSIGDVTVAAGKDIIPQLVGDADILLVRSVTPVNERLLKNSTVRFVATATIGIDHVDTAYLQNRVIGFASAPGSNANSVAEYVIASLLQLAEKYDFRLEGKSIGIIGVGNVGSKVAAKCAALGMRTVLNDPPLGRKTGDKRYRPLKEVFDCDIVTIHTPLTREGIDKTYHLADDNFFSSLKDGCIFLNTSRGAVAETSAIKNAILNKKVKAAVLDVWEQEPDIDIELLKLVDIGTPHIAGYSFDGKVAGMIMIYAATSEFYNIEPKFNIDDFLPAPLVPEIKINLAGNEQSILAETVQKIYDIMADDRRLREMIKLAEDKQGGHFTRLRKEYPVRREFQNTTIVIERNEKLKNKFSGIGFKVQ
ncbi:MAG: 4-phosphoerythronate dehydrogenase [Phycisphaerae bacterium]|nr:4-phosphoerythronate dehydrogenase [Phycisphaerae bacterium]